MAETGRLRIGILGAARIAPMALVRPARSVPEAAVLAVAARDETRARRFAARHGIPRVHRGYAELLADPEIDAVYNPLPNSLHCEWSIRALEAGKHVLCEKPLASNADEARRMTEAASRAGRVLVEAFHWRYHPLAERMKAIVESGELGRVRHVEASCCFPLLLPGDIRYRLDLAGGALLPGQHRAPPRGSRARGRLGRGAARLARGGSLDARRAALRGRAHRAHHLLALLGRAAAGRGPCDR